MRLHHFVIQGAGEVQDVLAVLPGAEVIPNQLPVDSNLVIILRQDDFAESRPDEGKRPANRLLTDGVRGLGRISYIS